MVDGIGKRLSEILIVARGDRSRREFAKQIGISNTYLDNLENGADPRNGKPISVTMETLAKISRATGHPIAYLTGESADERPHKKGVKIPVLGRVQAGIPVEAIEDIIGEEEITEELARTGEFFGLAIRGDSMSPILIEGDIIIVKRQPDVDSGELAVVLVNGCDATCKKVVKHKDGVSLVPLNAAHDPKFYTNEEVFGLPIDVVGKVVEMRRSF